MPVSVCSVCGRGADKDFALYRMHVHSIATRATKTRLPPTTAAMTSVCVLEAAGVGEEDEGAIGATGSEVVEVDEPEVESEELPMLPAAGGESERCSST